MLDPGECQLLCRINTLNPKDDGPPQGALNGIRLGRLLAGLEHFFIASADPRNPEEVKRYSLVLRAAQQGSLELLFDVVSNTWLDAFGNIADMAKSDAAYALSIFFGIAGGATATVSAFAKLVAYLRRDSGFEEARTAAIRLTPRLRLALELLREGLDRDRTIDFIWAEERFQLGTDEISEFLDADRRRLVRPAGETAHAEIIAHLVYNVFELRIALETLDVTILDRRFMKWFNANRPNVEGCLISSRRGIPLIDTTGRPRIDLVQQVWDRSGKTIYRAAKS